MRRNPPPPLLPELGYDSDGFRRVLRAPFPLTVDLLAEEFADLSALELGRALKIGATWWRDGALPHHRAMFALLGLQGVKARAVLAAHAHRFAPGSALAELRTREIARARRRFKLDAKPEGRGVVVRFPGGGAKV